MKLRNNEIDKLLDSVKPYLKSEDILLALSKLEQQKTINFSKNCEKKIEKFRDKRLKTPIPIHVVRGDKSFHELLGLEWFEGDGEIIIKGPALLSGDDEDYIENPIYPFMTYNYIKIDQHHVNYFMAWEDTNLYGKIFFTNKSSFEIKYNDHIYIGDEEFIAINGTSMVRQKPFGKAKKADVSTIKFLLNKFIDDLIKKHGKDVKKNGK